MPQSCDRRARRHRGDVDKTRVAQELGTNSTPSSGRGCNISGFNTSVCIRIGARAKIFYTTLPLKIGRFAKADEIADISSSTSFVLTWARFGFH